MFCFKCCRTFLQLYTCDGNCLTCNFFLANYYNNGSAVYRYYTYIICSYCPKNNQNLCIKTYSLSRLEQMQRFWFRFQSWQSRFFVWRFRLILRQCTRSYDLWLELFEWYLLEKMLNYLSLLQLPARTEGQCTGLHNTHLFCYWHCYLHRYDIKRRLYH